MTNIKISIILTLASVIQIQAQNCSPAGISTNPAAPDDPFFLNNVIDPLNPGTPFTVNPFLNTFDWGEIAGADFKTIGIDLCTYWEFDNSIILANPNDPCPLYYPMMSYLSDGMPSQFDYLKEPGVNALITDRDYHWEDGWELLWMNLGYLPDFTSIAGPHPTGSPFKGNAYPATPDNIPYFILYNRYRGIMRLVANVWDNRIKHQNIQVRIIQTGGNGDLTAILRAAENYDRPLSMTTNNTQVISPRFQSVLFNQWMVADFQMAYDPCTCISQGKFDIEFEQFSSMDIDMIGREISVTQDIDLNNYSMNDFMNLSEISLTDYKPGTMIYRTLGDMVSQYREKLDKYDQELNDYNSAGNQLIRSAIDAGEDLLNIFNVGIGGDPKSEESKNFKKVLAKGLDFAALEILPKTFDKPVKPTTTTATYAETAFKGTIGSTYIDNVGPFYMPGTFPVSYGSGQPSLTPFNYPAYIEILGQFALLQKPKLLRQYQTNTDWYTCLHFGSGTCNSESTNPGDTYPGNQYVFFESEHREKIWLKLEESLKYALNPALDFDMESTTVDVAFILTYKGMTGVTDVDLRIDREVLGSDFEMAHWFRPCSNQSNCTNTIIIETDWIPVGDAFGKVFEGEILTTASGDEAGGFNSQVYHPDNIALELDKIEMKLLVDMHFETVNYRGQKNNSTQAFTYLLWEDTPTSSPFEVTGDVSGALLASVDDAIHFGEVVLGNWTTKVNHEEGTWKSVRCDNALINSTLQSTLSGDNYSIDARESIRVAPGAVLKATGRLRIIDDPLAEFGEPVDSDFLEDFCDGTSTEPYIGNIGSISAQSQMDRAYQEMQIRKQRAKLNSAFVSLYPNPASFELTVRSQGNGMDQITILDAATRPVVQKTPNGANLYQINISNLSPGVYIVRADCGGEILSQKLVVTR